jgi:hypothetical protein
VDHDQFEHLIRAAGDLIHESDIVVIGSQSILAYVLRPPRRLTVSMELDILPPGGEAQRELISGVLGELSDFHSHHGVYADGVGPETATLPDGWRDRLRPYSNPNTNGITAHCLEPHDLVVSKLKAGREKDREFIAAAFRAGLVELDVVCVRLDQTPLESEEVERLKQVAARLAK